MAEIPEEQADPMRVLLKSKLRVKVHSAQGMVSKHKQGYNNTSVRLKIGEKVQETDVAQKQRAPVWSQSFDFLVPDQQASIQVTAYHHRKLKKDFLGRVVICVSEVLSLYSASRASAKETVGYLFRNKANLFDKDRGELYLSFDFVPIDFSVPSDPSSNSELDSYAVRGVSKKSDLLKSSDAYASLSRSKSLRFKSRSRPNLSSKDLAKQSFDWSEARLLRRENMARKAKYQPQWADTESETSISAKDSSTRPNSDSDSDSLSYDDYDSREGSFSHKLDSLSLFRDVPLQRGSPDGSCSANKSKELISVVREESPLQPEASKLRRSHSAVTVRVQSKPPSPPHEASRPTQSAVITGRRSERALPRLSLISAHSSDDSQQPTPRHEPLPEPVPVVCPLVARLEAREQEPESEEEAWNLSSFSSAEAETALQLRANSKEKLIHMILKQKQEFSSLERDHIETLRYLDEILSKIMTHHPELLIKN